MSGGLLRYEAACRALAAALAVDEVLDVRDQAEGLRAYAAIARNREMEADAAELRIRAERRVGEMMATQRDTRGLAVGARNHPAGRIATRVPTLDEAGIDKHLAHVARRYAQVPAEAFEAELARRRQRIAQGRGRITVTLFDDADKRARRAAREAALAEKIARGHLAWPDLAPGQRVGVILDDPEWEQDVWSRETGLDRAPDHHYPTSPVAEIAARTVAMIRAVAAPALALFRWTTNEHLAHAIRTIEVEGLTYRTNFVWDTGRMGLGRWNRSRHQILLLAVRGDVPCPAPGLNWVSLFDGPPREPGRHSSKPEHAAEMIEAYFPNLPKLEANRRGPARLGWLAWGDQVEAATPLPAGPPPARAQAVAPKGRASAPIACAFFDDEPSLRASPAFRDGHLCACVASGAFARRQRTVNLAPATTRVLAVLMGSPDRIDVAGLARASGLEPGSVRTAIAGIRRGAGAPLDLILDNCCGRGWRLVDATPARRLAA